MNNCNCTCSESDTNIPGSAGVQGISAYTTTSGSFTIPAADGVTTVDIPVNSLSWMVVGMYLAIPGLIAGQVGIFQVSSFPTASTVRVTYPALTSNTHAGDVIPSGSGVACSGPGLTSPLAVGSGGTGGTTKTTAQSGLGLGQDPILSGNTGLTQSITTSFVRVGAVAIVIPAVGTYEFIANVVLDFVGVTYAAIQAITIKVKNVTQGTDLASVSYSIRPVTTINYPNLSYPIPPFIYSAGVVNDSIELQITVTAAPSTGAATMPVVAGNLRALPLRKS